MIKPDYVEGNQLTLLQGEVEFIPVLIAAIKSAQRDIYLETYIFRNDQTGQQVITALLEAVKKGVHVHILIDGFGSRDFIAEQLPIIEAQGIQALVFRRELRWFSLQRRRLRRLHRKITVIDADIAFVGGININDSIYREQKNHHEYGRLDYTVRIEGPLLPSIYMNTLQMWRLVSWTDFVKGYYTGKIYAPKHQSNKGNIKAAFVIRDNLLHRHDIEDAYLYLIGQAQEELLLACAYFFPSKKFRNALQLAAERGVKIKLLLQGVSDHPMLQYVTRALYPLLQSWGIHLYEYNSGFLHAKVAIADQRIATVGSSNIDPFSLMLSREANIFVDDSSFAQHLHTRLSAAMQEGSVKFQVKQHQKLSWIHRLNSKIALYLARWIIALAGLKDYES